MRFLTEQVIPTLKQQYPLPANVKITLGGYSLAGLFALWASTQTDLFYGTAAASPMAAVGDNIRTLHSRLTERGADCTLEWNSGGHFKDADLRTAKALQWVIEERT